MKNPSIAARCANAKSGTITVAKFKTKNEADDYVRNNGHLLTPEVVSVEIAPNDIRFHDVLFSPRFRVEAYDGGFSVYASA